MKRNYDEIFKILGAIEDIEGFKELAFEGKIAHAMNGGEPLGLSSMYHLELLESEGYVISKLLGGGWGYGLTWKGHDLLSGLRTERNPRKS